MAAKEMTVRACQQGGFVVYDRIQMVQNPEPLAAFTEIRPALDFVLKAMLPVAEVKIDASGADLEAIRRLVQKPDPEGRRHLRGERYEPFPRLDPHHQPPGLQEQHLREVEQQFPAGRLVPRDETLMEDDRS